MHRFELKEGSSNKFWEGTVSGNTLMVRFGRIGSTGQEKSKAFATPALAQKEQDKLIAEKRGKGYKEVGPLSGAKNVPPDAAIKPAGPASDLPRTVPTTMATCCVAVPQQTWTPSRRNSSLNSRPASASSINGETARTRIAQPASNTTGCSRDWKDLADSKENLDGMIGFDFEDPKW